ncbi:MAG: DUF1570 domain-containing protein [Planctomycetota bacterium]|jgi:hypothetical protein
MDRLFLHTVVLLIGWCLLGTPATGRSCRASEQPGINATDWISERVELLDGRHYHGIIESEDDDWVHVMLIRRPRGRPMYLVIRTFDRASVASVVRAAPDERARVRQRIDQFRNRARIEAGRMEAVRLETASEAGNSYHRYRGKWFTLDSSAEESTTRRIIVRIEQIFTAYRQILAPRADSERPLRLVVLSSMEEYRAYLARLGVRIRSPACFIQDRNLVIAGSELARYAAEMAKVNVRHDQLRRELQRLEEDLSARLERIGRQLQREGVPRSEIARLLTMEKGKFQEQIQQKRIELSRCDRENVRAFQNVTRGMFARLYHEAFHAFLENYVYPASSHDVPRWLNEGLAVVLEGGLLESGTLRVDAPNREALRRLQADLGAAEPLPLKNLLAADEQAFLLGHDSDRYYAYSWGLAYYLTFRKNLLSIPALEHYVQRSAEDVSPSERFEKLVGLPLPEFEKQWREYILQLR